MNCVYLNSIGLYLDGQLAVNEKMHLEGHIQNCLECQAELRLLKLTGGSIRANKVEIDAADFLARLKIRIAQEKKINQENMAQVNDFGKWSKIFLPLPLVLAVVCGWLLLGSVDNSNPVEEYIFGKNLSDISTLFDQSVKNLG